MCNVSNCENEGRTVRGLCTMHYMRHRRASNPRRAKEQALRYNFGPDAVDHYYSQLSKQKGICAICKRIQKLEQDHNHTSLQLRGLLCRRCNAVVGALESEGSDGAVKYIEEWNSTPITAKVRPATAEVRPARTYSPRQFSEILAIASDKSIKLTRKSLKTKIWEGCTVKPKHLM